MVFLLLSNNLTCAFFSFCFREEERDVSERVALGLGAGATSGELLYDQRLFNQSQGLSSGFNDDDGESIVSRLHSWLLFV